jgi:acyl dehydratase
MSEAKLPVSRPARPTSLLTPEVLALIGATAGPFEAADLVEHGTIRRFAQAALDDDPLHSDAAYASQTRIGRLVAPALLPIYLFGTPLGAPDPLAGAAEPHFDGTAGNFLIRFGLPPLPVSLTRFLNGGQWLRVCRHAEPGDRVFAHSRYVDIFEKQGSEGPLLFAIAEATFTNQRAEVLLICRQTLIWR